MIEVRITDNIIADGIDIYVSLKGNDGRTILQSGEDGRQSWKFLDRNAALGTDIRPTLTVSDEIARALLDALLRRYEGASDMRTVRSDLLHERGRVDGLIGFIQKIILEVTQKLSVDDFGRQLGCLLNSLLGTAVAAVLALAVLGALILAGVL